MNIQYIMLSGKSQTQEYILYISLYEPLEKTDLIYRVRSQVSDCLGPRWKLGGEGGRERI